MFRDFCIAIFSYAKIPQYVQNCDVSAICCMPKRKIHVILKLPTRKVTNNEFVSSLTPHLIQNSRDKKYMYKFHKKPKKAQ